MKKILTIVLAGLLAFTSAWAAPVKIGVVTALTGNLAYGGEDCRDGVLLYQQMHPEVAKDVQFIFEDDMSSPAGSAKAALKLIEVDKVQAIVTYFGYGTEAIAPIAKRKGVMVMALTFDLEHIAAPDSYAIWPSMKSHNEIMAATLKELGYKNVGIVVARSQGAVRAMDDLQTELKRIGVNNPSRIDILMSERDMRSVILKMNEAKCDIWVACLYRPGIDLLLRDANRLGDGWAVTGITCFDSLEDLSLANGRWYVRTALPTSEFESAFKAKTGHLPNPTAVYGYDAAKFLDEAFSASKGDLAGAKAYLAAQKTLSGEGGEYTSNGNGYFSSPAILATVRNGHIEGVTLEELKAAKK